MSNHSIEMPIRVFKHGVVSDIPPIPDWLSLHIVPKKSEKDISRELNAEGKRKYLFCKNRHNVMLPREQMTIVGNSFFCPECMEKRNAKANRRMACTLTVKGE